MRGQQNTVDDSSLVRRLIAVRSYMRSIGAACLDHERPFDGDIVVVERHLPGLPVAAAGGYAVVACVGDRALVDLLEISDRGEMRCSGRLYTVPRTSLEREMLVGRESMILAE